ncbi:hypothetical protein Sinac_0569 [Singulisphaera acidiphila DSM 18658]|uniref:Lipoprotein n=1 Tax=Singulisphaera acidiphila (strain ATCC BAA-1392 / DSM 18658 / VKM B-2454 / MOB10) TaxID=886293 RepID=L0D842_SINAD|nr:hypothetical protein Sinac_0569 [Singulisphaera acidiphila DSM 18658]
MRGCFSFFFRKEDLPNVRSLRFILISACLYVLMAGLTLSLSGCGESSSEPQATPGPTKQDEDIRKQMVEFEKSKSKARKK